VPWHAAYPSILPIVDEAWTSGRLFGVDNGGPGRPHVQDALAAYRAEYGEDPLSHFLCACDSATLPVRAMRAGGTDAAAIAPGVARGGQGP
jgi:hypothetical protein